MSLSTLRPRVVNQVRDGSGLLESADFDELLQAAAERYSRARPRLIVADVAGDGGHDYDLPASWEDGWSELRSVEYPAGARNPVLVDRLDWTIYDAPAGPQLRLLADSPQAGETIRLTFTGLHTIEEAATTVPAADHQALVYLGAMLACEQLSSHYSNTGDTSVMADSVDHSSKARDYAARAKRFRELANELVPLPKEGTVSAAGGETSFADESWPLSHRQR